MYLFNQSKLKSLLLVVISLFIVFLVSHTYLGTYFVQITINSPGDDTSTIEWPNHIIPSIIFVVESKEKYIPNIKDPYRGCVSYLINRIFTQYDFSRA